MHFVYKSMVIIHYATKNFKKCETLGHNIPIIFTNQMHPTFSWQKITLKPYLQIMVHWHIFRKIKTKHSMRQPKIKY